MNTQDNQAKAFFPKGSLPVALCDQLNAEAVIIDLAAEDPTAPDAILWRWTPSPDNGFEATGFRHRIDDCKLKYSTKLQKHVVCTTSSAGFMGIAEFPSGKKIWEDYAHRYGPHSIDYLPNGTVAVALSGNAAEKTAELRLYACDENGIPTREHFKYPFISAHGVVWDQERELLWALGRNTLMAFKVEGTPQAPELKPVEGLGCEIHPFGHDLTKSLSHSNRLYFSSNSVYSFDMATNTLYEQFDGGDLIKAGAVKSVSEHTDGSILRTVAAQIYAGHDTNILDVFRKDSNGVWSKKSYVFEDRAFYKARPVIL